MSADRPGHRCGYRYAPWRWCMRLVRSEGERCYQHRNRLEDTTP